MVMFRQPVMLAATQAEYGSLGDFALGVVSSVTHLPTPTTLCDDRAIPGDWGYTDAMTEHGDTSPGDGVNELAISVLYANYDSARFIVLKTGDSLKPVWQSLETNAVKDGVLLEFRKELFRVEEGAITIDDLYTFQVYPPPPVCKSEVPWTERIENPERKRVDKVEV